MAKRAVKPAQSNDQPTAASEWRERMRGVVLTLPSGMRARVRGVQPSILMQTGRIPDLLTPAIAQIVNGEQPKDAEWKLDDPKNLKAYFELINAVCASAVTEPRIVIGEPKSDDEISINDVEDIDKEFLFSTLGVSVRQIEGFRDKQEREAGTVEPVDAPEGDAPPSE